MFRDVHSILAWTLQYTINGLQSNFNMNFNKDVMNKMEKQTNDTKGYEPSK